MAMVTIRKSGTAKSIQGRIRNEAGTFERKLTFDVNGQARIELPPDRYLLGCVVKGKAGSTYKLAVTAPAASRCDVSGTIGQSGLDFGVAEFEVF